MRTPIQGEANAMRDARLSRRIGRLAAALALGCFTGCAGFPGLAPSRPSVDHSEVYRRAEGDRADRLRSEIMRLRTDLAEAEAALVAAESGLRGKLSRADAVSRLAEARIQVERAAAKVPWRAEASAEARAKLEEADRQLQAGHFGSAIFFASRAQRGSDDLLEEARRVARSGSVLYVTGQRVNLRAGPSTREEVIAILLRDTPVFPERHEFNWLLVRTPAGRVGWIHEALLSGS